MLFSLNELGTPLQYFKDYVSLKLHFNGDLEWKPDVRIRLTEETLSRRPDSGTFYRLPGKYKHRGDYVDALISALYRDRNFWIGDLDHQDIKAYHKERIRRAGALLHTFKIDVGNIIEYMEDNALNMKAMLKGPDKPRIITDNRKIIGGVTDETLAVLDHYFDFCGRTKSNDPLWNERAFAISRYKYVCRPSKGEGPEFEKHIYKLLGM